MTRKGYRERIRNIPKKTTIQKNDFEEVSLKNLFSFIKEFYILRQ